MKMTLFVQIFIGMLLSCIMIGMVSVFLQNELIGKLGLIIGIVCPICFALGYFAGQDGKEKKAKEARA